MTGHPPLKQRWHYIYFILAGFDLLTVLISVFINHNLTEEYQRSLKLHQEWAQTLEYASGLTQAVLKANVAGNDVFDAVAVSEAREVEELASRQFKDHCSRLRDATAQMTAGVRHSVAQHLANVETEMEVHDSFAAIVFAKMDSGDRDAAGTAMARMDRSCGVMVDRLSVIRRIISDQHVDLAQRQMEQLSSTRQLMRIVFVMVGLMVIFVAAYGLHLSRRARDEFGEMQTQSESKTALASEMSSVARLAAGVAHELRNPLTSVSLLVQNSLRQGSTADLDRKDLNVVSGELQRMERTLNAFIDFARPPKPRLQQCNLNTCVFLASRLVAEQATLRNIAISVTQSGHCFVNGDSDLLQQLMLNLLLNAIEATPNGGEIRVIVEVDPENVILAVEDTGPGIDSQIIDDLFQPFVSGRPNGIGLGLGICRRIAVTHGGEIRATNIEPQGARLVVNLPRTQGSHSEEIDGQSSLGLT